MQKIQIRNCYSDSIIFECEAETIKECVEKAVSQEEDLQEADLREANLQGADLWGADLREANLQGADLNALFYKTRITKKQLSEIVESDLFEVVDDSASCSNQNISDISHHDNCDCQLCSDVRRLKPHSSHAGKLPENKPDVRKKSRKTCSSASGTYSPSKASGIVSLPGVEGMSDDDNVRKYNDLLSAFDIEIEDRIN